MKQRVSVMIITLGAILLTSVATAKAKTFYDLNLFKLDLPAAAAFTKESDNPLSPMGISIGAGIKSPLEIFDDNFIITPSIALEFTAGKGTERLYNEWAYAHSDIIDLAIRPALALGWQTRNKSEIGLEWAYYNFKVEQGIERWSHTNYTRDFRVKGIGLSIYYRSNELTFKFTPRAKLDCSSFGKASLTSIAASMNW